MEVRYFLANKKSWSDVTISVNRKDTPKKGDIINVGKIKMTVKDVVDATIHGRAITKVLLESTGMPYTELDEAIDMLENPTFIEIDEDINEARSVVKGNPASDRTYISADPYQDSAARLAGQGGPGSFGQLGNYFRSGLQLGQGYGVQVADFGEAVTITITYSNPRTCRTASQSYVVVYRGKNSKYVYTTYANSGRYRHSNDYTQAISFIRSKASTLPGSTSTLV